MDREIKFRAWNKETKQMISWNSMLELRNLHKLLTLNFVEVMQYTGLKDKKGKEIYEGDIVQRGVILFDRGKFQGYYTESNGGIAENWEDDLYQERDIEVVGNMFENPELMRGDG